MKFLTAFSFLLATVSAGVIEPRLPLLPVLPELVGDSRIVGGLEAAPGQFPYQVGLSLNIGDKSAWCGGTLIYDRWVLTAAHCTDSIDSVIVYLGAHDIKNFNEPTQRRIYVEKKNVFVHEGWNPATLTNDISLIKLPVPIEFNEFIQSATLPKKGSSYDSYEGEIVVASGWGKDSDKATSVSPILRYVEVPVMKESSCNKYYFGAITNEMICISGKGGKSTCNGDSGGPLVKKEEDVNYVIGATSFGIALGCEKGWPGVFTRVTSYLDWIEEKTGNVNK